MCESDRANGLEGLLRPLVEALNSRIRQELSRNDEPRLLKVYRDGRREQLVGKTLQTPISSDAKAGATVTMEMIERLDDAALAGVRVRELPDDAGRKFLGDVAGIRRAMEARAAEMAWTPETLAVALARTEPGLKEVSALMARLFPLGVLSGSFQQQSPPYVG